MKDNITLIGMPGSGKSTVGVLLAKALGLPFIDTDLLIQQREGLLLQELLDQRGLDAFLDAEEAAIRSLDCRRKRHRPRAAAPCAGSGPWNTCGRWGRVLYLRVPLPELERRIDNITTRGIAHGSRPDPGGPLRLPRPLVRALCRRRGGCGRRYPGADGGRGAAGAGRAFSAALVILEKCDILQNVGISRAKRPPGPRGLVRRVICGVCAAASRNPPPCAGRVNLKVKDSAT